MEKKNKKQHFNLRTLKLKHQTCALTHAYLLIMLIIKVMY